MKMSQADYTRLDNLIKASVKTFDIRPFADYPGISNVRYVWDVLWITMDTAQRGYNTGPATPTRPPDTESYLFIRGLMDQYKSDHITTALKRILL